MIWPDKKHYPKAIWQHYDADPKAIWQIKFVRQLKNVDGRNSNGTQNMFVLSILEKIR